MSDFAWQQSERYSRMRDFSMSLIVRYVRLDRAQKVLGKPDEKDKKRN
jgi:hypothetical protein